MSGLPASFWASFQRAAQDFAEDIMEGSGGFACEPIDACVESPIEKALAVAVLCYWRFMGEELLLHRRKSLRTKTNKDWSNIRTADLIAQPKIGSYRADFLLVAVNYEREVRFVIECDGHDFHERTKEQAARDRKRDREMTALGYTVLRFTGSEIHRDAFACAEDIYTHFDGRICDAHMNAFQSGRS